MRRDRFQVDIDHQVVREVFEVFLECGDALVERQAEKCCGFEECFA